MFDRGLTGFQLKLFPLIFMTLFPNLITTEGGFLLVLLGLGFYLFGKSKKKTSIFYLLFLL